MNGTTDTYASLIKSVTLISFEKMTFLLLCSLFAFSIWDNRVDARDRKADVDRRIEQFKTQNEDLKTELGLLRDIIEAAIETRRDQNC